jgi:hypothetical protein
MAVPYQKKPKDEDKLKKIMKPGRALSILLKRTFLK